MSVLTARDLMIGAVFGLLLGASAGVLEILALAGSLANNSCTVSCEPAESLAASIVLAVFGVLVSYVTRVRLIGANQFGRARTIAIVGLIISDASMFGAIILQIVLRRG